MPPSSKGPRVIAFPPLGAAVVVVVVVTAATTADFSSNTTSPAAPSDPLMLPYVCLSSEKLASVEALVRVAVAALAESDDVAVMTAFTTRLPETIEITSAVPLPFSAALRPFVTAVLILWYDVASLSIALKSPVNLSVALSCGRSDGGAAVAAGGC